MITPMVARLVPDPFDREGWLFELKWDGFRAIAERDHAGQVSLYSRNQKDFRKRFPEIAEAVAVLKRPAIPDGEIVALDEKGHPRFEWLVNRGPQKGILIYYVFDLLMLDGKDLRHLPLVKRKQRLGRFLTGRHQRLFQVEHIEKEGVAMFAGALALRLEGVVAKDSNSPYVEGPTQTWHWQKIKNKEYKRQGKVEFRQSRGKV
jgi:bifunctional non-homologous end joining protein LigD